MLAAVSLDSHARLNTEEIKDVSVDGELTTESEAFDLMLAENRPEISFCVGWLPAHFSCEMMEFAAAVAAA
jgi:hypothetical protein